MTTGFGCVPRIARRRPARQVAHRCETGRETDEATDGASDPCGRGRARPTYPRAPPTPAARPDPPAGPVRSSHMRWSSSTPAVALAGLALAAQPGTAAAQPSLARVAAGPAFSGGAFADAGFQHAYSFRAAGFAPGSGAAD